MILSDKINNLEKEWGNYLSENNVLLHINTIDASIECPALNGNIMKWIGIYNTYNVKIVPTKTRFILPAHMSVSKTKLGKILYP